MAARAVGLVQRVFHSMNHLPLENLKNLTAVITGAAGDIAQAAARRLQDRGAKIIGLVHRPSDLDYPTLTCDVTDPVSISYAVSKIHTCDILINNAGFTKYIPHNDFDTLTDDLFDNIMQVNLRSVFSVTKSFMPLLKKSTHPLVINISSTAGVYTGGSNIAYAAAKAGVDSLTRNLSKALAPIRFISICPGAIDTKFLRERPKEFLPMVAQTTPLNRAGTAEDVAAAIEAYAMTLRFVTGEIIIVDGGRSV